MRSRHINDGVELVLRGRDPLALWNSGARWYFKDTAEFETAIWDAVSERERVLLSLSRRERGAVRHYRTEWTDLGDRSHRAYLNAERKLGFVTESDLVTLELAGK